MSLFRTIVFVAAVAEIIAGLVLTATQQVIAVRLILKAETITIALIPIALSELGARADFGHPLFRHGPASP